MENSQSKIVYLVFDLLFFLFLLAAGISLIHAAEKVQSQKENLDVKRNSMIVETSSLDGELIEDAGSDVYVGENEKPSFRRITGEGDVVTKGAVFTDLLNMPSGISKIVVDGDTYANGSENEKTINGAKNIAYLIKNGKEKDLYKNILQTRGDTFLRTYLADGDGNITGVIYKTKTM